MRILFCGLSGIPNNFSAGINRYLSIADATEPDNEVIFINRFPLFSINDESEKITNKYKIIDASGIKYRPNSFLRRNIIKILSFYFEFKLIFDLNKKAKIAWINVYTQYLGLVIFYYFLSRLIKAKTILHYVEFRTEIRNKNWLLSINDFLFDKYAIRFCDRLIPISHFLETHAKSINPRLKSLIIPPICELSFFDKVNPERNSYKYFIYCGSIAYQEIIHFIVKAYLQLETDIQLHLVISGKITNSELNILIENHSSRIFIFKDLNYNNLIAKFKGSLAQLIPLRNTIQDKARFPQKICEYLASGRPIITTNIGEIEHYFLDEKNALVAQNYDVTNFTSKMKWAIDNPIELEQIAQRSYTLAKEHFQIKNYRKPIKDFLSNN